MVNYIFAVLGFLMIIILIVSHPGKALLFALLAAIGFWGGPVGEAIAFLAFLYFIAIKR